MFAGKARRGVSPMNGASAVGAPRPRVDRCCWVRKVYTYPEALEQRRRPLKSSTSIANIEHVCDDLAMVTKIVACRGCGRPATVNVRSRPREHYCSEACRPTCDYPGCSTPVPGLGGRCWTHRSYDVPADRRRPPAAPSPGRLQDRRKLTSQPNRLSRPGDAGSVECRRVDDEAVAHVARHHPVVGLVDLGRRRSSRSRRRCRARRRSRASPGSRRMPPILEPAKLRRCADQREDRAPASGSAGAPTLTMRAVRGASSDEVRVHGRASPRRC